MDGNEEVGKNGVAIYEACERPVNNVIIVENFGEQLQYPTREWQPLGLWKNHILPQHGEEQANVARLEVFLRWSEVFRYNRWKLMGNFRSALHRIEKLRNLIVDKALTVCKVSVLKVEQ